MSKENLMIKALINKKLDPVLKRIENEFGVLYRFDKSKKFKNEPVVPVEFYLDEHHVTYEIFFQDWILDDKVSTNEVVKDVIGILGHIWGFSQ